MGRDRAAYMREYRKRVRQAPVKVYGVESQVPEPILARIRELEAEVARLKRELANRPVPGLGTFSTRPFTPVPKTRK